MANTRENSNKISETIMINEQLMKSFCHQRGNA